MNALYYKTVGNHEMFFVIKYLHLHSSLMEVLSSISKETPMQRMTTQTFLTFVLPFTNLLLSHFHNFGLLHFFTPS